jgi:hypothetical protein
MGKIDILRTELLHASGKRMVMLGGDVYEQRTKGDVVYEFKWVGGEPVMLIYKRTLGANSPAYMIEMNDAHLFAQSNGYATKELMSKYCHDAAKAVGCEHDKATIFRMIDVIVDGVDILLGMPPEPKAIEIANRPSSGNDELTIKIDGQTVAETMV